MSQNHKETLLKLQEPASVDVGSAADYIALMKPRVMSLVVFTALVGLVMAPGAMHPVMAVAAIALIAVGAGASAALNMWYDADIDAVMSRTKTRPVPAGRVTPDAALTFGLWVSGLSVLSMAVMINYLSAALLAFTIFFYAVIYTMFLKRRTAQNIVIGGAAGALPPVIGWAAAANSVSIEPLIYFAIIFFWTPPHFWALALIKNDDYQAANVPMLPVTAGSNQPYRKSCSTPLCCLAFPFCPMRWALAACFMPAARHYWVACLLPFASAWRWHLKKPESCGRHDVCLFDFLFVFAVRAAADR